MNFESYNGYCDTVNKENKTIFHAMMYSIIYAALNYDMYNENIMTWGGVRK